MKLITKAIEQAAPALYTHENTPAERVPVVAKFFDPTGRMTFFMTEYDSEDRLAFGWMVSPLGPDCDEMGYVSIDELEAVQGAMGLGIERDRHLGTMTLADAKEA